MAYKDLPSAFLHLPSLIGASSSPGCKIVGWLIAGGIYLITSPEVSFLCSLVDISTSLLVSSAEWFSYFPSVLHRCVYQSFGRTCFQYISCSKWFLSNRTPFFFIVHR